MSVGTVGGGFLGQLDLAVPFISRAVSNARSPSAGYVVGGVATVFALPVLFMLRRLGGDADEIPGPTSDLAESTIPSGFPRATGVEAHPVPIITGR
jgi:hypothetical protein